MAEENNKPKRVLSIFSLVMINVIAVDSLRSLPFSAEYGFSLVFFYILGALLFFLPIAVVAAELATGWPNTGGLYVWVREAFGKRWALVTIWLLWIYNVVWYPTILTFLASTLAYVINPALGNNLTYTLIAVITAFWLATLVNCFGMKLSSFISILGAIIGTLLPMLLIIILSIIWLSTGHPSEIGFSWHDFFPDVHNTDNLAFIVAVLFGLIGMEMSAMHAEEVRDPQRDYPKALLYSTLIIILSLILASLAIAVVIPHDKINIVSGLIEAFSIFFNKFHMAWMSPIIAILIIIGGMSGVSAWVIGPTKGLLAAARDDCLPTFFQKTSKRGVPINILLIQGTIFTILCSAFLVFPDIKSTYWILSALTAQLAMMVYLFMFAAAIALRYKRADTPRAYRVPGGKFGMWLIAGIGFITCTLTIALGFLPPPSLETGNLIVYEGFLIFGIVIFSVAPLFFYRTSKHHLTKSSE